jgi:hypothetical protein
MDAKWDMVGAKQSCLFTKIHVLVDAKLEFA